MPEDLETMLNEVHKPVYNVYLFCPLCERRMFSGLFQEHTTCCHCRGLDAYGNKEESIMEDENVR